MSWTAVILGGCEEDERRAEDGGRFRSMTSVARQLVGCAEMRFES